MTFSPRRTKILLLRKVVDELTLLPFPPTVITFLRLLPSFILSLNTYSTKSIAESCEHLETVILIQQRANRLHLTFITRS